ncbi:MAG TPA: PEGA domain-containing protein, partial [Polyangiaceae bacterium]|nr:PEGA domain-containing protein [Polyangiaceae bacterium]
RSPDTADKPEVERQIARLQRDLGRGAKQQVTIFTDPQGATLLVDGQPVGISPWTGELGTGRHQLVARRQGNIDTLREFSLVGDQATELTVSLAIDQQALAAAHAQLQRERSEKERASQPSAFESIRPVTWGILGAGVAGLAGAAVFEQSRANDEQDARLSTTQVAAQRSLDDAQSQQTAARILLGVGAGAAILGGVFLYVDLKHHSQSSTQLAAGCGTGKCGLFARGKF